MSKMTDEQLKDVVKEARFYIGQGTVSWQEQAIVALADERDALAKKLAVVEGGFKELCEDVFAGMECGAGCNSWMHEENCVGIEATAAVKKLRAERDALSSRCDRLEDLLIDRMVGDLKETEEVPWWLRELLIQIHANGVYGCPDESDSPIGGLWRKRNEEYADRVIAEHTPKKGKK